MMWEEKGEHTMHPADYYYKGPGNIGYWVAKNYLNPEQELTSQIQEQVQATRETVLPEPLKDL